MPGPSPVGLGRAPARCGCRRRQCRERAAGRHAAARRRTFSGHSQTLRPGAANTSRKPASSHLARVTAVEIKVAGVASRGQAVGLHHRIAGALDAPGHAQGSKQVAHEAGLAGAQRAVQFDHWRRVASPRAWASCRAHCAAAASSAQRSCVSQFLQANTVLCSRMSDADQRSSAHPTPRPDFSTLWASCGPGPASSGFSQIAVSDIDLRDAEAGLLAWLERRLSRQHGLHGRASPFKRARPAELVPGTLRVITARMDYLPRDTPAGWQAIEWQGSGRARAGPDLGLRPGRDYHKVLRARLQQLADRLTGARRPFRLPCLHRFGPVRRVGLASRAGLAWRGKHSLAVARCWLDVLLGEIFVDLLLPVTPAIEAHCGSCSACQDVCPTQAIVAPTGWMRGAASPT